MLTPRCALMAATLLAIAPTAAFAARPSGWSAVQDSRTVGSQIVQTAKVTYGHHRLRVDHPGQRLILDLSSGALTIVNLRDRTFSEISMEGLVELRESQEKEVRKGLTKMPPEIRAQMEAQLEDAARAARRSLDAKDTGETRKQGGLTCSVFAWTTDQASGTACIAQKGLPFDPSVFRKDSLQLARKMERMGAGNAATSMAVLQLGEHGFPLVIDQTMTIGAQQLSVASTFTKLERSAAPKAYFEAPSGFTRRSFETMMREAVSAAPAPQ
ncbi:MAG: hypothetical protein AAFZ18_28735 [Myxococcota bacterium]